MRSWTSSEAAAGASVRRRRISPQRSAWAISRSASSLTLAVGASRASSLETIEMVASGVPSSWAAAAARAPRAESRCSRASTAWVTSRARAMREDSSVA